MYRLLLKNAMQPHYTTYNYWREKDSVIKFKFMNSKTGNILEIINNFIKDII